MAKVFKSLFIGGTIVSKQGFISALHQDLENGVDHLVLMLLLLLRCVAESDDGLPTTDLSHVHHNYLLTTAY